jgi:peptidoglycan hydrolase-like protein with peptidoglycan-binding domain
MLPYIINDDLSQLVQISMAGSVGQGGGNDSQDVRLIQTMLNQVPAYDGGPSPPLKVDGFAGQKTSVAISRFQQANGQKPDGRIDVAGRSITALGRYLISRGLIPNVPGIGPPDANLATYLKQQVPITSRARNLSVGGGEHTAFGETGWAFSTSGGVSLSAGKWGVAAGTFHLVQATQPVRIRIFPWSGVGAGFSAMPVGFDASFAVMPSHGFAIRQTLLFGSNPMPEEDLTGFCTVLVTGISGGVGVSLTTCAWGSIAYAFGSVVGAHAGMPGASITAYWGFVGRPTN